MQMYSQSTVTFQVFITLADYIYGGNIVQLAMFTNWIIMIYDYD